MGGLDPVMSASLMRMVISTLFKAKVTDNGYILGKRVLGFAALAREEEK